MLWFLGSANCSELGFLVQPDRTCAIEFLPFLIPKIYIWVPSLHGSTAVRNEIAGVVCLWLCRPSGMFGCMLQVDHAANANRKMEIMLRIYELSTFVPDPEKLRI